MICKEGGGEMLRNEMSVVVLFWRKGTVKIIINTLYFNHYKTKIRTTLIFSMYI